MLMDKVRKLLKFHEYTDLGNRREIEMAQALIAVDDVLKEAAKELAERLKDGIRNDGKRLLLLQIRKALEPTKGAGDGNG